MTYHTAYASLPDLAMTYLRSQPQGALCSTQAIADACRPIGAPVSGTGIRKALNRLCRRGDVRCVADGRGYRWGLT